MMLIMKNMMELTLTLEKIQNLNRLKRITVKTKMTMNKVLWERMNKRILRMTKNLETKRNPTRKITKKPPAKPIVKRKAYQLVINVADT